VMSGGRQCNSVSMQCHSGRAEVMLRRSATMRRAMFGWIASARCDIDMAPPTIQKVIDSSDASAILESWLRLTPRRPCVASLPLLGCQVAHGLA